MAVARQLDPERANGEAGRLRVAGWKFYRQSPGKPGGGGSGGGSENGVWAREYSGTAASESPDSRYN